MMELLTNLLVLLIAAWNVIVTLLGLIIPWTPLIAWVAFWLLAVNWVKLSQVLASGGWIGVLLIGLMMILVWSVVAPPDSGQHHLFGLHVGNVVGKTVYVVSLLTIMMLCGSVQLSGACGSLATFQDPEPVEDHGHDHHGDHGHSNHSHGHDSHGDSHGHASHDAHGTSH